MAKHWKGPVPDLSKITVKAIEKGCAHAAEKYPPWPHVLYSTDLSANIAAQPPHTLWWIPARPPDDGGGEGAPQFDLMIGGCTLLLKMSAGCHQSKRLNKGKPPAPPDEDVEVEPKKRGRKRTAERAVDAVDEDEEMNDADGDPTPRKETTMSDTHPPFHVVVRSPTHTRPKQRLRVNEAGDAVSPPTAPVPTPVLWLGRGPVSSINTFTIVFDSNSDLGQMHAMHQCGTEHMCTAVGGQKALHRVRTLCTEEEAMLASRCVVEHGKEASPGVEARAAQKYVRQPFVDLFSAELTL